MMGMMTVGLYCALVRGGLPTMQVHRNQTTCASLLPYAELQSAACPSPECASIHPSLASSNGPVWLSVPPRPAHMPSRLCACDLQKFIGQPGIPVDTAVRVYRRYLKLEPTHTEEFLAYLRTKVRYRLAPLVWDVGWRAAGRLMSCRTSAGIVPEMRPPTALV